MKDVSLDDALTKTFHLDAETTLLLYSVSGCLPCDIMEQAISSLEINTFRNLQLLRVKLDQQNKRELGKAVLNGISSFPRLDLFVGTNLSRSMVGTVLNTDGGAVKNSIEQFISQ